VGTSQDITEVRNLSNAMWLESSDSGLHETVLSCFLRQVFRFGVAELNQQHDQGHLPGTLISIEKAKEIIQLGGSGSCSILIYVNFISYKL